MSVDEKITKLVTAMVMCHEDGDFARLTTLMDQQTLDDNASFFTQEKFEEVCQKIHEQLGHFIQLEYIGFLDKQNSVHTLWKAKYSNTAEDTLWQARINLADRNPKIIRMSVN
ncbi:MAG: hypothetical protein OEX07_16560 [Gammaproteobacteria bacterium]|nr:hypothetical protein [Gammaproteobacteria bacterium]